MYIVDIRTGTHNPIGTHRLTIYENTICRTIFGHIILTFTCNDRGRCRASLICLEIGVMHTCAERYIGINKFILNVNGIFRPCAIIICKFFKRRLFHAFLISGIPFLLREIHKGETQSLVS